MVSKKEDVALALINESDCLPLKIDDYGNTPLHICASFGYGKCVEALLSAHYPLLIRDRNGKTAFDVAKGTAKSVLDKYVQESGMKFQAE